MEIVKLENNLNNLKNYWNKYLNLNNYYELVLHNDYH